MRYLLRSMRDLLRSRMAKFGVISLFNYPIKIGLTVLLTEVFALWYLASYIISTSIVIAFNFFYNLKVVFGLKRTSSNQFVLYTIFTLFFMGSDVLMVKVLTDSIGVYYVWSIICVTATIFLLKFYTYATVVFVEKTE
ncbi:MAG: GtrA family protein [Candidatus Scalindua sp.]